MTIAQERTDIVEKAVDCLRIVTTGNDANKRALVEIPIAVPALVSLLSDDPTQVRCHGRRCRRVQTFLSAMLVSQPLTGGTGSASPALVRRTLDAISCW